MCVRARANAPTPILVLLFGDLLANIISYYGVFIIQGHNFEKST